MQRGSQKRARYGKKSSSNTLSEEVQNKRKNVELKQVVSGRNEDSGGSGPKPESTAAYDSRQAQAVKQQRWNKEIGVLTTHRSGLNLPNVAHSLLLYASLQRSQVGSVEPLKSTTVDNRLLTAVSSLARCRVTRDDFLALDRAFPTLLKIQAAEMQATTRVSVGDALLSSYSTHQQSDPHIIFLSPFAEGIPSVQDFEKMAHSSLTGGGSSSNKPCASVAASALGDVRTNYHKSNAINEKNSASYLPTIGTRKTTFASTAAEVTAGERSGAFSSVKNQLIIPHSLQEVLSDNKLAQVTAAASIDALYDPQAEVAHPAVTSLKSQARYEQAVVVFDLVRSILLQSNNYGSSYSDDALLHTAEENKTLSMSYKRLLSALDKQLPGELLAGNTRETQIRQILLLLIKLEPHGSGLQLMNDPLLSQFISDVSQNQDDPDVDNSVITYSPRSADRSALAAALATSF